MRLVLVALLLAGPAAAQDLTSLTGQQASSPETAWAANLAASGAQNVARNIAALAQSGPQSACPPGQVSTRPAPAVGQPLSGVAAPVSCEPVETPAPDVVPQAGPAAKPAPIGTALTEGSRPGREK